MIRSARAGDVAHLPAIERAAGAAFRDFDMAAIADDDPLPPDVLLGYQRTGRAWVATDNLDRPVAYLLIDVVDGAAHVEQVSVDPDYARRGLGRCLLDAAAAWAQHRGLKALTLTTFTDVPWNAPYYSRLGFEVIPDDELTPGLRRIREHEATLGLDNWPRAAMRRRLPTSSPDR